MSVNIDEMGAQSMDYGEFRYQQVQAQTTVDPTNETNPSVDTLYTIEPLSRIGGLDPNEVAELVYLEVYADLEFETESESQGVASGAETRGVVGINLPASEGAFVEPQADEFNEGQITEIFRGLTEGDVLTKLEDGTDDKKLQMFRAHGSLPYDNAGTGAGGSGYSNDFYAEKSYRDLTNRGPVLDSNDDVSIAINVNVANTNINVSGVVRVHMVWDVAEVDDAGRAFSVPTDD
jgi:hypothetical protein